MLTPIPEKVDDPKEAVLWSVYNKLQQIDENQGTRINFAMTIAYNHSVGANDPVFKFEIDQIREILKIPAPPKDIVDSDMQVRDAVVSDLSAQLRDEL